MVSNIFSADHKNILGINRRNLDYVYPSGNRKFFKIADEKSLAKEFFLKAGIPFPETLKEYEFFTDIMHIEQTFGHYENVVIKPNKGRGGSGIMVLGEKTKNGILDIDGNVITYKKVKKHLADIIMGVYSFGNHDKAIIETRLFPHSFFKDIYAKGLADFRFVFYLGKPVMAMLRVPTSASHGKANLHQGGIGIGIDLQRAVTTYAIYKGDYIETHPDTKVELTGLTVPYLDLMLHYSEQVTKFVGLQYIGFDFTLDEHQGPLLLEINARPGLEIQKANKKGLLEVLNAKK